MATIALQGVRKSFGTHPVIHGVSFDLADGEFLALVGPSDCGKSTLLRMIAGLERVSAGTIRIGERVVNDLAPKDRDVAMVFQSYALYPNLTVARNIAQPLRLAGMTRGEIDRRVDEAARVLGLDALLDRYPRALSGGQRQRVAMGRAIVREPDVFLFDEPLSNLDAQLRVQMRAEIKDLVQRLGTTTVYVTHDQVEALTMADRVAVMQSGRVEQMGAPLDLYDRPANAFVAAFVGSPAMNLLAGRVVRSQDMVAVVTPGGPACPWGPVSSSPRASPCSWGSGPSISKFGPSATPWTDFRPPWPLSRPREPTRSSSCGSATPSFEPTSATAGPCEWATGSNCFSPTPCACMRSTHRPAFALI